MSFRAYLAASRIHLLILAVTTTAMFIPAVIVPYAFSDDYSILWMAVSGEPSAQFGKTILASHATGGRPFAGLLSTALFGLTDTIADLRFIRAFSVLMIVALAVLVHWALVRSRVNAWVATLIEL